MKISRNSKRKIKLKLGIAIFLIFAILISVIKFSDNNVINELKKSAMLKNSDEHKIESEIEEKFEEEENDNLEESNTIENIDLKNNNEIYTATNNTDEGGIVQYVMNNNLSDGIQNITVKGKTYRVDVKNFNGDKTYNSTTAFNNDLSGINKGDYSMLILKYHGNLTVGSGVTITAPQNANGYTYKKGMYICVLGKLENNGTISMTARGTYNCEGEDVYLWKHSNSKYDYVAANGSEAPPAQQVINNSSTRVDSGTPGTNGYNGTYTSKVDGYEIKTGGGR